MVYDEEQLAALAMSDILTSAMFHAYDAGRRTLYVWERAGYAWLIRFKDRRPDGLMCGWSSEFMKLNRAAILGDGSGLDFNLRAARLKREAASD